MGNISSLRVSKHQMHQDLRGLVAYGMRIRVLRLQGLLWGWGGWRGAVVGWEWVVRAKADANIKRGSISSKMQCWQGVSVLYTMRHVEGMWTKWNGVGIMMGSGKMGVLCGIKSNSCLCFREGKDNIPYAHWVREMEYWLQALTIWLIPSTWELERPWKTELRTTLKDAVEKRREPDGVGDGLGDGDGEDPHNFKTWPTRMRLALAMLFKETNWETVQPTLPAIPERVSPDLTV